MFRYKYIFLRSYNLPDDCYVVRMSVLVIRTLRPVYYTTNIENKTFFLIAIKNCNDTSKTVFGIDYAYITLR